MAPLSASWRQHYSSSTRIWAGCVTRSSRHTGDWTECQHTLVWNTWHHHFPRGPRLILQSPRQWFPEKYGKYMYDMKQFITKLISLKIIKIQCEKCLKKIFTFMWWMEERYIIWVFFINSQHLDGTGSWNPSLWKTRTHVILYTVKFLI